MQEKVSFEYQVSGKTPNGETASSSGKMEFQLEAEPGYPVDDGEIMTQALSSVMEHFYVFEIEKRGLQELSEVQISIKLFSR